MLGIAVLLNQNACSVMEIPSQNFVYYAVIVQGDILLLLSLKRLGIQHVAAHDAKSSTLWHFEFHIANF